MEIKHYDILDKGFIKVLDVMGNDLTIVNAARVSYNKRHASFDEKSDTNLLTYLCQNKHTSPFRHPHISLHIKAPDTCLRQIYKHVVGIDASAQDAVKDHAWNEISGRYIEYEDFYIPDIFRKQSKDSKQASYGKSNHQKACKDRFKCGIDDAISHYKWLIQHGVCKEQARMLLPFATYSEVHWTASFHAIMNFIELRDHPHAQYETKAYAEVTKEIMYELFPHATKAWLG